MRLLCLMFFGKFYTFYRDTNLILFCSLSAFRQLFLPILNPVNQQNFLNYWSVLLLKRSLCTFVMLQEYDLAVKESLPDGGCQWR